MNILGLQKKVHRADVRLNVLKLIIAVAEQTNQTYFDKKTAKNLQRLSKRWLGEK